jgi:hypothetical protein
MSLDKIRKGDKWICIKPFDLKSKFEDVTQRQFEINEIITFKIIDSYDLATDEIWGSYHNYINQAHIFQIQPYSANVRNITISELKEHFMCLADFRDKRIDQILEDD